MARAGISFSGNREAAYLLKWEAVTTRLWTHWDEQLVVGGETYVPNDQWLGFKGVNESKGLASTEMYVVLSAKETSLVREVQGNIWDQGVEIGVTFPGVDQANYSLWSGSVVRSVVNDLQGTMALLCESWLRDIDLSRGLRFSKEDQQREYERDLFFNYAEEDSPVIWTDDEFLQIGQGIVDPAPYVGPSPGRRPSNIPPGVV